MQGRRRKGRQKKRWEDNIKEWTELDFASSTRAAEDRTGWKGIVVKSAVMPNDLIRLWDKLDCTDRYKSYKSLSESAHLHG